MKIVFMGTPDFAAVALEALCKEGLHEIGFVISQPDKPKNRGKKVVPTPVKEVALKYGLEVLQPERIKKDQETISRIREYGPDVVVVAAYGQILSKEILDIPKYGCINIHGSLLPAYRGAAPIQWAIINGEEKTGITIMQMAEGLDTGDMISKAETPIERKTFEQLHDELADIGAKLLLETLPLIESGKADRIPQKDEESSYAPMIFKKDGLLDFEKSPYELERLIRGYTGAYTYLEGEIFKVWSAEPSDEVAKVANGTIISADEKGIKVSSGGKTLTLLEVQASGKKRMKVSDFLRGKHIESGTVFTAPEI